MTEDELRRKLSYITDIYCIPEIVEEDAIELDIPEIVLQAMRTLLLIETGYEDLIVFSNVLDFIYKSMAKNQETKEEYNEILYAQIFNLLIKKGIRRGNITKLSYNKWLYRLERKYLLDKLIEIDITKEEIEKDIDIEFGFDNMKDLIENLKKYFKWGEYDSSDFSEHYWVIVENLRYKEEYYKKDHHNPVLNEYDISKRILTKILDYYGNKYNCINLNYDEEFDVINDITN